MPGDNLSSAGLTLTTYIIPVENESIHNEPDNLHSVLPLILFEDTERLPPALPYSMIQFHLDLLVQVVLRCMTPYNLTTRGYVVQYIPKVFPKDARGRIIPVLYSGEPLRKWNLLNGLTLALLLSKRTGAKSSWWRIVDEGSTSLMCFASRVFPEQLAPLCVSCVAVWSPTPGL
jgi:hypothetical protein